MQHLAMYCSSGDKGALLRHSDQYRGIEYAYATKPDTAGATTYSEPSADYFQLLDLGEEHPTPVGYGHRSVEYIVRQCVACKSTHDRAAFLQRLDEAAIMATPANSRYNEAVVEAGRESILNGGREVAVRIP